MLSRLRDKLFGINKIRFILREEYKLVFEKEQYLQRELKAMEILRPYFPEGFILETGFSISYQTIQHILNDIYVFKPKVILEFGSGLSTLIINKFLEKENLLETVFISIDQDKSWQELLKPKCPKTHFFDFEVSKDSIFSYSRGVWYEIPEKHDLLSLNPDLVIVDAPKGSDSEMARYGVLPFLRNQRKENLILYLDDTNRTDERNIGDLLKTELGFQQIFKGQNYSRFSNCNTFYTNPK